MKKNYMWVQLICILVLMLILTSCTDYNTNPKYKNNVNKKDTSWQDNAPSQQYVKDVNQVANDFGEDPEHVDAVIRRLAEDMN